MESCLEVYGFIHIYRLRVKVSECEEARDTAFLTILKSVKTWRTSFEQSGRRPIIDKKNYLGFFRKTESRHKFCSFLDKIWHTNVKYSLQEDIYLTTHWFISWEVEVGEESKRNFCWLFMAATIIIIFSQQLYSEGKNSFYLLQSLRKPFSHPSFVSVFFWYKDSNLWLRHNSALSLINYHL